MDKTPRDYTQELIKLAEDYFEAGEELAKIQIEKSSCLLILMTDSKSIKEAELKWGCQQGGKRELELIYKMRGLKELISANKVKIRVMNNESYNQY